MQITWVYDRFIGTSWELVASCHVQAQLRNLGVQKMYLSIYLPLYTLSFHRREYRGGLSRPLTRSLLVAFYNPQGIAVLYIPCQFCYAYSVRKSSNGTTKKTVFHVLNKSTTSLFCSCFNFFALLHFSLYIHISYLVNCNTSVL